jgi:O-antigen/teichoic acid export membrane protein
MAYLVLLAVPLILFQEANKGILWGLERIGEYNLVNLIRTGLFLLFSAPLLIFISRSAEAAVTGWLAGLLLSAGASAWFILKDRHFSRPPADSAQVRSDSLRIGWRTFLISALFMVSAKADIYVLKFFLSDAAIGYYSLVVLISSMANIGPAVVGLLLFNKTLTEGAIGITQTAKLSRICLAYSFVLAACLAVLGKPIFICLFGDSFVKSYYCLLYYLPALVAQNLIAVLAMFICAKRGFPFFDIATLLEVLVAGIILNILLVPKLGINGSAIAASVAISIRAVMDIIYFKRLSRLSLSEALLVKKGDIEEIAGILRRSPLKV